jgi:hypothetical protein
MVDKMNTIIYKVRTVNHPIAFHDILESLYSLAIDPRSGYRSVINHIEWSIKETCKQAINAGVVK